MYKTNFYFEKYGFQHYLSSFDISKKLGIIVTIPAHNELNIIETINSLHRCIEPKSDVEVIIVINSSENSNAEVLRNNQICFDQLKEWKEENSSFFKLYVIHEQKLPKKHAGVGLARKIAMDEACLRFHQISKEGIIVCFDADSQCEENYFIEIEKHFESYPLSSGCSIKYAHPIEGNQFDDSIYEGIINYELHLRYYNQSQKLTGYPGSFHTVGSSMAVRNIAYEKQGGMNKKKAGEDFYFLHKIIELGNFSELNTTSVIPSPRPSDRVPFGTGKAIMKWLEEGKKEFETYALESFIELKYLFDRTELIYRGEYTYENLPLSLKGFFDREEFQSKIKEINKNSSDYEGFKKRFFVWFNAFRILKFVHYSRDEFYPNLPLLESVQDLYKHMNWPLPDDPSKKGYLLNLRSIESNNSSKSSI